MPRMCKGGINMSKLFYHVEIAFHKSSQIWKPGDEVGNNVIQMDE